MNSNFKIKNYRTALFYSVCAMLYTTTGYSAEMSTNNNNRTDQDEEDVFIQLEGMSLDEKVNFLIDQAKKRKKENKELKDKLYKKKLRRAKERRNAEIRVVRMKIKDPSYDPLKDPEVIIGGIEGVGLGMSAKALLSSKIIYKQAGKKMVEKGGKKVAKKVFMKVLEKPGTFAKLGGIGLAVAAVGVISYAVYKSVKNAKKREELQHELDRLLQTPDKDYLSPDEDK